MAVSLDPFRNIVNVQWAGGVFIVRATFRNIWWFRGEQDVGPADEIIPAGTDPFTTDKAVIPWRVFCRVMEPLDASGMIPQVTVGRPVFSSKLTLDQPTKPFRQGDNHTTGNYKWLAWVFDEYFNHSNNIDGTPEPDPEVFNMNLRDIETLPKQVPALFLPNRLKGIQAGYVGRGDAVLNGAYGPSQGGWNISSGWSEQITEVIWTVNLSLLPPPFVPGEIAYRFRLDFVRDPEYVPDRVQNALHDCAVTSGMYIPPKKLTHPTEEEVIGTIEPCEQNGTPGFTVGINESGAVIDILVLRGEPWTGGPPKILMVRQV